MPVVQRLISADQGLNLNPGFTTVQKPLLRQFFLFFLKHAIIRLKTERITLDFLQKLSNLKSGLTQTLGYPNLALNNLALDSGFATRLGHCLAFLGKVLNSHAGGRDCDLIHAGRSKTLNPAGWTTCLEWRHFSIERCKCKLWLWLCVHLEQDTLLSEVVSFLRSMNRYWQTVRESWQISGLEETYNG